MTNNTTELKQSAIYAEMAAYFDGEYIDNGSATERLSALWDSAFEAGRSAAHGEPSKADQPSSCAYVGACGCKEPCDIRGHDEFLSKRLARVAKLAGVPMPDMTHEQIAECAGTILGSIAGKLEAASKAGSAEQVSETAALRKLCDQLDAMKRRMRHTPGTGQNHSYLLHEDVAAYVEEARAALQSAPERKALSDDDILRIFYKEIDGEGFALYEVTPGNMIAFARALLAQASAQSADAGSVK